MISANFLWIDTDNKVHQGSCHGPGLPESAAAELQWQHDYRGAPKPQRVIVWDDDGNFVYEVEIA